MEVSFSRLKVIGTPVFRVYTKDGLTGVSELLRCLKLAIANGYRKRATFEDSRARRLQPDRRARR
jgi:hypothetical protein